MTKIYRIQDAAGRGPYKPGVTDTWADPDNDGSNCPAEIPPKQLREMIRIAASKGFGCHFGFGFRTMEQLGRWFTPTERIKLAKAGYCAVEMEVDLIIAETESQVLFCRKTPLRELVKE
jgi:hypothetical protein